MDMEIISGPTCLVPFFMDPGTPMWEQAWAKLASDGINDGLTFPESAPCPLSQEVWEYMGSFDGRRGSTHEFRHRHHPAVNRRVVKRVFLPSETTGNQ